MDKCLYKVDFVAKTITITAECAEKMNDPDTTEYRAIRQLCADFPAMKIVKRTHRTPRKYVSKSTGEKCGFQYVRKTGKGIHGKTALYQFSCRCDY